MTPTAGGTSHTPLPTGKDRALPAAAQTIAGELSGFRREMLRFAVLQLRDQASAEDAVQEAMLAALQGADRFGERARLKTWVFSILRNKIVDIIRRRVHEPSYQEPDEETDEAEFDPLFRSNGHRHPEAPYRRHGERVRHPHGLPWQPRSEPG